MAVLMPILMLILMLRLTPIQFQNERGNEAEEPATGGSFDGANTRIWLGIKANARFVLMMSMLMRDDDDDDDEDCCYRDDKDSDDDDAIC